MTRTSHKRSAADVQYKVQATTSPEDIAKAARNKGIQFHNEALRIVTTDKPTAYRLLCSCVTVDPTLASGWWLAANSLADLKWLPASIAAFRRLMELPEGEHPDSGDMTPTLFAKAAVNLGHRLLNEGRIEEAHRMTLKALHILENEPELDPEGAAFVQTNLSLIYSIYGEVERSLQRAQRAFDLLPSPIIETGLGFALLFAGDYAAGLRHFQARFAYRPEMNRYLQYPYSMWDGSETADTLFIAADQGLGDSISFARFVPEAAARCGKVLFQVQPQILRMMSVAFAGIPNIEVIPLDEGFPIADLWCPVVSLPVALDLTTEQIRDQPQGWTLPPLDPSAPPGWKDPKRFSIGICWAGAPNNEIDRWRSVPVTDFLELYRVPGIQLYSIQVGDPVKDLHANGCAALIRDMSPWIRDAADTMSLVHELDLVITIESFVGHLCGAMDKECWVLSSARGGDWRVGRTGNTTLWYPHTWIFRQGTDMAWPAVWDSLVDALQKKLADALQERVSDR